MRVKDSLVGRVECSVIHEPRAPAKIGEEYHERKANNLVCREAGLILPGTSGHELARKEHAQNHLHARGRCPNFKKNGVTEGIKQ